MTQEAIKEKLNYLVKTSKRDANLCLAVSRLIAQCDKKDRGALVKDFIISFKEDSPERSTELPVVITKLDEVLLLKRYADYIEKKLTELIRENKDEDAFYSSLAEFVFDTEQDNQVFPAIALLGIGIERRLPYHPIDLSHAISMDPGMYMDIMNRIGDETIKELDAILRFRFEQKTEAASVLLSLIEKRESFIEQVVLFTRIFTYFEENMSKLIFSSMLSDEDIINNLD